MHDTRPALRLAVELALVVRIAAAREDLRTLVTLRQEAQLVTMGILE